MLKQFLFYHIQENLCLHFCYLIFPIGSDGKESACNEGDSQVWSLSQEDPLEKGMATPASILAWRIPWTKEPGELQSLGLQRIGHDWATEHTRRTLYLTFKRRSNEIISFCRFYFSTTLWLTIIFYLILRLYLVLTFNKSGYIKPDKVWESNKIL